MSSSWLNKEKNRFIIGDGCESASHLPRFIMNVTCDNRHLVIPPEAHISRKIHCVKNIAREMRQEAFRSPSTDVTTQLWWWGQSSSNVLRQKIRLSERISSSFEAVMFRTAIFPKFTLFFQTSFCNFSRYFCVTSSTAGLCIGPVEL